MNADQALTELEMLYGHHTAHLCPRDQHQVYTRLIRSLLETLEDMADECYCSTAEKLDAKEAMTDDDYGREWYTRTASPQQQAWDFLYPERRLEYTLRAKIERLEAACAAKDKVIYEYDFAPQRDLKP